ncbi:MAG: hypothetical protein J5594_04245 [Elusimicrobiaceae bacterium]|nr:hypothetical protein [Elusimicrobiaceae bacterium]
MNIGCLGVIVLWLLIVMGFFIFFSPLILLMLATICIFKIICLLIDKKWKETAKWLILLLITILFLFYGKVVNKDSKTDYPVNTKIEQITDNASQQDYEIQKETESSIK